MPKKTPKQPKKRTLLVTLTNEPVQPVRLYYAIPDRVVVTKSLRKLRCMDEVPEERCWQWLFEAEAADLPIADGYEAVPAHRRPIVLGRVHFPREGSMTITTNSMDRALAAARFFAPRLGTEVVAMRCRMVNRFFAGDEGPLDELMKLLDQDVTVIDPRAAEEKFKHTFEGVTTLAEAERVADASMRDTIASGEDVPNVEDFPLAPEEETPEFKHLETTLNLRKIRAMEHWKGNTHLTLSAIILRTIEQHMRRNG